MRVALVALALAMEMAFSVGTASAALHNDAADLIGPDTIADPLLAVERSHRRSHRRTAAGIRATQRRAGGDVP
jgi:hypothetical protein